MSNRKKIILGILAAQFIVVAFAAGILIYGSEKKAQTVALMNQPQIVVFGDSIWDNVRDDTGIGAQTAQKLDANVYNLSIAGTGAARIEELPDVDQTLNHQGLYYMVRQAVGLEEAQINPLEEAMQLIDTVDFAQTDYFVIAYGLNDYFNAVPRVSEDEFDTFTYGGSLRYAISLLQEYYPEAKIVVLSQTYCQGYSYGKVDSESDTKDYGAGTGPDYVAVAQEVASDMGVIFINNYEDMGINIRNGASYLSDATHLTAKGRAKYAKILSVRLIQEFREDNQ